MYACMLKHVQVFANSVDYGPTSSSIHFIIHLKLTHYCKSTSIKKKLSIMFYIDHIE